jgi:plasmid stability protein
MHVNLSIKSVPAALAERLRQRAARNHRSLQGELMAIIEHAAAEPEPGRAAVRDPGLPAADRLGSVRRGSKSVEQIASAHRLRHPEPIDGLPLAVDIVRQARDSRGRR